MRKTMVGALSAAMLVLAGCGSSGGYANRPRPPAPVNVAVNLTNARVSISPARIGAGPAVLLVANTGDRSRDLTLTAPNGSSRSCLATSASSGPINPQGTARVAVELVEGDCLVGVRDASLRPARLVVGAERTSAQADLLQP
jgi:hypothetical protein